MRSYSGFRNTLFDLPDPESFYEQFFSIRPGKSVWATVPCVFHDDRHPSLSINLESGAFFCHACEARGRGIVDFYMLNHGVDFKTAINALRRYW